MEVECDLHDYTMSQPQVKEKPIVIKIVLNTLISSDIMRVSSSVPCSMFVVWWTTLLDHQPKMLIHE